MRFFYYLCNITSNRNNYEKANLVNCCHIRIDSMFCTESFYFYY